MGMSDSERRLLLSGTLDTSGVGAGGHEHLSGVAVAWQDVTVEPVVQDEYGPEPEIPGWPGTPDGSEHRDTPQALSPEPVVPEPEVTPEVPLVDRPKIPVKRTAAKKTTAPKK